MQHLTARVTQDARVKTFENGRSVVNFKVVKNRYYKNKEGKRIEQAEFFQCSYWRTAKIAPYITKGQVVELLGEPSADCYIGIDGKPVPVMRLKVNEIIFHSAQKKAEEKSTDNTNKNTAESSDDLPF
ncbi:single-stranded DNA-binding protein [Sphingobacterium detergens]|uniref:Single-stranded DNA-binding protein n=1 Tax=Sphingobacterium detergens TaxID=1145106 RepID=A0A420ARV4_SPHD1|nr:single-stranded DNA-binding protein [Sphingobacterium detergens]RKE47150.1 single-strand DNA-binding protein [Sphingobacterium detergens]